MLVEIQIQQHYNAICKAWFNTSSNFAKFNLGVCIHSSWVIRLVNKVTIEFYNKTQHSKCVA